jgi:hypothetical protein
MKAFKLLMAAIVLGSLAMGGESFAGAPSNLTQSIAGGGVTAKVTYLNPKSGDEPRFQVVLDTHSVNLDAYDLRIIAELRDDSGKIYSPTAVENKGSGHHRETFVSFPKPAPATKRIELVIKELAGMKERTFVWTLE